MSSVYYNEFDPKAAAWLRELIAARLIPEGDVDERSIKEVKTGDLKGYRQAHFFAGIGGWAYAIQLAGWPTDRPVWTGSCPCQSLSVAGRQRGASDERHLWPEFARLIEGCRPPTIFGEQVASKLGRSWLAGIQADMEAMGYFTDAADLSAAGIGAPHIRQRLYWLADTENTDRGRGISATEEGPWRVEIRGRRSGISRNAGGGLAKPGDHGTGYKAGAAGNEGRRPVDARAKSIRQGNRKGLSGGADARSTGCGLGHPPEPGLEGYAGMSQTGTNPDGTTRTRLDQLPRQAAIARGMTRSGSPAQTEKRGALNPALSRWLMGYPEGWDCCGATAMQSCRKPRKNS